MAQEIEILVALHDSIEVARTALKEFPFKGQRQITDTYYYDPLRKDLGWSDLKRFDNTCRIREQDQICKMTYKVQVFDGDQWLYADEYETSVGDADTAKMIFAKLGLKELVVVRNTRHVFETDDYEIVVEDVADLGCFLEVEYKHTITPPRSIDSVRADIMAFIDGLGLNVSGESVYGKPELMLMKQESSQ